VTKPTVQTLVGMIASGKSTYARNAAAAGAVVVNDDAVVAAVHGGDYRLYDKRLKPLYKATENAILAAALALGRDVVVDRGVNVSVRSRRRWVGLATAFDATPVCLVFAKREPAVHARRRCEDDPRGHDYDYWLRAAERHHADWESPTREEGFDDVLDIDFDDIRDGWLYGRGYIVA
jgi:predicted kinase